VNDISEEDCLVSKIVLSVKGQALQKTRKPNWIFCMWV